MPSPREEPFLSLFGCLPGLAGRVAGVAGGLALGRLGGIADQLLDGLLALARLALGPIDGLLLGTDAGLLLLLRLADRRPLLAGLSDLETLLAALEHIRIVGRRPRLEPLQHRFAS